MKNIFFCIVLFLCAPYSFAEGINVVSEMSTICSDDLEHIVVFGEDGTVDDISFLSTPTQVIWNVERLKHHCASMQKMLLAHCHVYDSPYSSFPSDYDGANSGDVLAMYSQEALCVSTSMIEDTPEVHLEHALVNVQKNELVVYGLGDEIKKHLRREVLSRHNLFLKAYYPSHSVQIDDSGTEGSKYFKGNIRSTLQALNAMYVTKLGEYLRFTCSDKNAHFNKVPCREANIQGFANYAHPLRNVYFYIKPYNRDELYHFD